MKDQRWSVITAARSASAWNAGSPAGAIASAYSRITATLEAPINIRSIAARALGFSVASSASSTPARPASRRAKRTPVARL